MIKHFLGCLIKNMPVSAIATISIPHRNYPIGQLIHPNTYAYFIFDSEFENQNIVPINLSPVTYLGGKIYTREDIETEAIKAGQMPCMHVVCLPGKSHEEIMETGAFIHTANNTWMPFFDDDILINIKK